VRTSLFFFFLPCFWCFLAAPHRDFSAPAVFAYHFHAPSSQFFFTPRRGALSAPTRVPPLCIQPFGFCVFLFYVLGRPRRFCTPRPLFPVMEAPLFLSLCILCWSCCIEAVFLNPSLCPFLLPSPSLKCHFRIFPKTLAELSPPILYDVEYCFFCCGSTPHLAVCESFKIPPSLSLCGFCPRSPNHSAALFFPTPADG